MAMYAASSRIWRNATGNTLIPGYGDSEFATRWRLIKADVSKRLPVTEKRSGVRRARGEPGLWQRRHWEHLIRDEADLKAHMAYLHFNPVKHGPVNRVADWPYSTFHRVTEAGVYPRDWAGSAGADELEGLD